MDKNSRLYVFIIEGSAIINDNKLKKRDGIGIWETENISINAEPNLKIINDGSAIENI